MRSDLGQRLTVAAIGIPVTVAVTYLGGPWFAAGLAVLAAVAVWEIGRMVSARGDRFVYPVGVLLAASYPLAAFYLGPADSWGITLAAVVLVTGVATLRIGPEDRPFQAAALTLAAALYVGGLISFGVLLRERFTDSAVEGTLFFFLPVTLTWLADTAAYFGGRAFGKHKLAPIISPNKTVEGAISALVAGPLGALIYGWVVLPRLGDSLEIPGVLALGLVVAIAATLGDLAESALKRECGVKDSSRLLPGHGGLLDRMDSLLWSIPAACVFLLTFL
ncbi:MAG: phosphatidate cytidylyltransferase [Gemmatimonadetes bacterium]|nr:phosphatidate cytidylyltransferase [Gemmatimonadota bacterium]MBT8479208.1 phosphatidate cytidylyltransferase [Gemmatimonadota bacterium]NNK47377.1 phosphatidate cytidylyltransferase [Gemmatimonadota bacterium]